MKPKSRYIPTGSKVWQNSDHCIAYLFMDGGYPCAIGYSANRMKPDFNYRFITDEIRRKYLDGWVARIDQAHDQKAQRKDQKSRFEHGYRMGDILHGSTGYDMIINHWYQVIRIAPKTITIRKIQSHQIEHSLGAGIETPLKDKFVKGSKEHIRKPQPAPGCCKEGLVTINRNADQPANERGNSLLTLQKWNGCPTGYDTLD